MIGFIQVLVPYNGFTDTILINTQHIIRMVKDVNDTNFTTLYLSEVRDGKHVVLSVEHSLEELSELIEKSRT